MSAKIAIGRYVERLIMSLPLQLTEASSRPSAKSSETDREAAHSPPDTPRCQTILRLLGYEHGRPCHRGRVRPDSKTKRGLKSIVPLRRNEFERRYDRQSQRMSPSGKHSA